MNISGHIAIAVGLAGRHDVNAVGGAGPDAAELLGVALPDVGAMGRFRLLGRTSHAGVSAGIRLHYRSDEAFHRHPWFRDHNRALTAELVDRGFGRGPAKACSHVGIELLLDGSLLRDPTVAAAYQSAFGLIPEVRPQLAELVEPAHQAGWLAHLDRLANRSAPTDLAQPPAVALRLLRILAGRPRLAFRPDQTNELTAALARHQPSIEATSASLAAELVDQLADQRHGAGKAASAIGGGLSASA